MADSFSSLDSISLLMATVDANTKYPQLPGHMIQCVYNDSTAYDIIRYDPLTPVI